MTPEAFRLVFEITKPMSLSNEMRFHAFTLHAQCHLKDNSRVYQLFLASWAATIATYTCSSTVEFLHARADDDGLGTKEAALQATVTSNAQIADIVLQVVDDVECGKFHRTQSTLVAIQQQDVPDGMSDSDWALQSPTSSLLQSSDSSDGETDIRSPVPSANVCEVAILQENLRFIVADSCLDLIALGLPDDDPCHPSGQP